MPTNLLTSFVNRIPYVLIVLNNACTVEPLNKGHIEIVPCREVVLILEVNLHKKDQL